MVSHFFGRKLFRARELSLGAAAAMALVAYFHDDIGAIAFPNALGSVDDTVLRLSTDLPRMMPGGSTLEAVERAGDRVVLSHALPPERPVREAYRELAANLCEDWRPHLRRGEIAAVETRYHRSGQDGVFYLNSRQCR
ncbi:hypothetical protein [Aureimonas populi]